MARGPLAGCLNRFSPSLTFPEVDDSEGEAIPGQAPHL